MKIASMFAQIRTQFEGLHNWPDAQAPVEFLKFPHRHMFHVVVRVEQFHDERDVEYVQLRRKVDEIIASWNPREPISWSCERYAAEIGKTLSFLFFKFERVIEVEVSEDGENGAVVRLEPEK